MLYFHVKDNGFGIPKEKQDGLFNKFYQVDTSMKRKHGGTGLGLSICKEIIEGLGGKIWVENNRNFSINGKLCSYFPKLILALNNVEKFRKSIIQIFSISEIKISLSNYVIIKIINTMML